MKHISRCCNLGSLGDQLISSLLINNQSILVRSHEQLRTVIGRVLRQSAGAAPDGDAAAAGGAVAEGENASEAVHAAYEIVKVRSGFRGDM